MSQSNHGILTLIAPQTIEEDLVDFFLDREHQYGFTSQHVRGHTSQHSGMSVVEQVTGRQQRVQFQILVTSEQARCSFLRLEASFPRAGIHYGDLLASVDGPIVFTP